MKTSKYTALCNYAVTAVVRQHNIWQRDTLAIRILNKEMAA